MKQTVETVTAVLVLEVITEMLVWTLGLVTLL